jgi:hypothetical protein
MCNGEKAVATPIVVAAVNPAAGNTIYLIRMIKRCLMKKKMSGKF